MTPHDGPTPHDGIHPNDRATLYDLVDGRLAPRAEDEVRRRLDDEPDLRLVYEQIVSLRDRLAALPVPAIPADFLERVRAKAGFPAAPPAAKIAAKVEAPVAAPAVAAESVGDSPAAATSAAGAPSPRLGRVLSFARYAYGIAALLVVALGVAYWKLANDETAAPGATESVKLDEGSISSGAPEASKAKARAGVAMNAEEWKDASGATGGGGGAVPHFGPVGALPPGLRTPSDDPNAERPPAAPVAAAGRAAPPTVSPGAPADDSATGAVPAPAELAGRRAGVAAEPTAPPADVPSVGGKKHVGYLVSDSLAEADDELIFVRSDSYDAARAEVAVWLADVRAGRAPDARRLAPRRLERPAVEADKALGGGLRKAKEAGVPGGAPTSPPPVPPAPDVLEGAEAASDTTRSSGERMLGSFVVELEVPAFERLSRSLGAVAAAQAPAAGLPSSKPGVADAGDDRKRMDPAMDGDLPSPLTEPSPPAAPVPLPAPSTMPGAAPAPASPRDPLSDSTPAPPKPTGPATPVAPPPSPPTPGTPSGGPLSDAEKAAKAEAEAPEPSPVRRVRIVVLPSR